MVVLWLDGDALTAVVGFSSALEALATMSEPFGMAVTGAPVGWGVAVS